ncbi:MAG TPA: hypothetical protein VE575_06790 [Acidimicrobiales bacterium]|nr:hypothetical protein [Acidimicrobiales bacterium]
MTTTVSVVAPKGGQGATTVAATLAVLAAVLGVSRDRTEPWDVCGNHRQLVAATSRPARWAGDVQIIDGPAPGADSTVLVVRNCYLAVRKAAAVAWVGQRADHVVVIREPGRAITPRDIAATVGLPATVVTTLEADPAVARSVDAGLLTRPRPPRSLHPLRALSPGADEPAHRALDPGIDPPARAAFARIDAAIPRRADTGGRHR